jgi:hypothetical protein
MRLTYSPMTLGNMRANGVRTIAAYFQPRNAREPWPLIKGGINSA